MSAKLHHPHANIPGALSIRGQKVGPISARWRQDGPAGPAPGSPRQVQIADALEKVGSAGALLQDLAPLLGLEPEAVGESLWRMSKKGTASSWPDPLPRWRNRLRWFAPHHKPAKCPQPSGILPVSIQQAASAKAAAPLKVSYERGVKVTKCVGAQVDVRYQCAPGERITGAGFAAMPQGTYFSE